MSTLVDTLDRYAAPFYKAYGARLSDAHRHALSAIRHCRTEHYGELTLPPAGQAVAGGLFHGDLYLAS